MGYSYVQCLSSRRALYKSIVHQSGKIVQDNRKGLVRKALGGGACQRMRTHVRAGGPTDESDCRWGLKTLLKVSRELGVSTWGIDTPWGRNLGSKSSSRLAIANAPIQYR